MPVLVSRCLSAAGLRFSAILSRQGIPPLLRSAYRHQVPDPDGVSTFRTHEIRPDWGRVAGAHCCAPAPSEPDKPVFRASRLKQAQRLTGRQKSHFHWSVPTGAGSRNSCV